jgi:hypothetical protein
VWRFEILEQARKRSIQVTARKLRLLAARRGARLTPLQAREELDWLEEEARRLGLTVVREGRRGRPRKLYLAPSGVSPYLDFLAEE